MSDVAWLILGGLLTGAAVVWAGHALIRWRRKSPHCPKCEHDLSGIEPGVEGVQCPECGVVTVERARLMRRSRRWKRAALAFVVLAPASQMMMFPLRPDRGWTRWAPTTGLILFAGRFDFGPCLDRGDAGAWMHVALIRRQKHMWEWQRERWFHPVVVQAIREEWGRIRIREVWPKGVTPSFVSHMLPSDSQAVAGGPRIQTLTSVVQVPPWRGAAGAASARISISRANEIRFPQPEGPGEAKTQLSVFFTFESSRIFQDPLWAEIPAALETADARFRVSPGLKGTGTLMSGAFWLPKRTIASTLRYVETIDEAIAAAPPSASLDALVPVLPGYTLFPDTRDWPNASPSLTLESPLPWSPPPGWPEDIAFALKLGLRYGESETDLGLVMGFPLRANRDMGHEITFDTKEGHVEFRAALARFAAGEPDAWEGWTLIITGDQLAALMETDAPMYWNGRIEVPFRPRR